MTLGGSVELPGSPAGSTSKSAEVGVVIELTPVDVGTIWDPLGGGVPGEPPAALTVVVEDAFSRCFS